MANKGNFTGTAFWVIIILSSISGLIYLGIWSYHNNSVKGLAVSLIFALMIVLGIVMMVVKGFILDKRFTFFDDGTWSTNCFSFTLGFFLWLGAGKLFGTQSIIAPSDNNLLAAISSELPQVQEMLTKVFVIPFSEELFWMVFIPFSIIIILYSLGAKFKILRNPILNIVVIMLVGGITFALFHVGKLVVTFLIAAFIFRVLQIGLVFGEHFFDIIKGVSIVMAFALGSHVGSNLVNFGISKTILLLNEFLLQGTWMIYAFFLIIFLSALNQVVLLFSGDRT